MKGWIPFPLLPFIIPCKEKNIFYRNSPAVSMARSLRTSHNFFRIVVAIRQKAVKAYGIEQAQERQEEKKIGKIYENQGEEGAVVRQGPAGPWE